MDTSTKKHRLFGLDIFRVLLAFLVFIFHSWCHMKCTYGVFQPFVEVGALAMTGFFMLSGFSLAYAYQDEELWDCSSIRRFLCKRLLGILPLYYIVAVAYTALFVLSGRLELWKSIILIPVEVLGIQSMFSTLFPIAHNQGTWFISDLLVCYFMFPLVSLLTGRRGKKESIFVICFLTALLSYSPIIVRVFSINSTYTNPFFRFLEFCLGINLCNLYRYLQEEKDCIFKRKWFSVAMCLAWGGSNSAHEFGFPTGLYAD